MYFTGTAMILYSSFSSRVGRPLPLIIFNVKGTAKDMAYFTTADIIKLPQFVSRGLPFIASVKDVLFTLPVSSTLGSIEGLRRRRAHTYRKMGASSALTQGVRTTTFITDRVTAFSSTKFPLNLPFSLKWPLKTRLTVFSTENMVTNVVMKPTDLFSLPTPLLPHYAGR